MVRKGVVAVLCAGLLGCPGTPEQDSGVPQPVTDSGVVVTPPKYTVGGIVTGLTGALTLRVRDVPFNVGADGAFEVPGTFDDGEMYALSVDVQPFRQECALTRGDGTVRGADVTDVLISCRDKYVVGGTITGLTRDSLTLTMGAQSLTVHAGATRFEFLDGLVEGSMWAMSLATDPGAQSCRFTTPEAGVVTADVSVQVACMDGQFDIPGFAEGVNAPITLVDELSSSEVTVSASGSFQIVLRGPPLRQYRVAVKTPSLSQYCTLENTEGFLRPGNPMPVLLKCVDKRRLVFWLHDSQLRSTVVSVNSDGTQLLDIANSASEILPAFELDNRLVVPRRGRQVYLRDNGGSGTPPWRSIHAVNLDGGQPILIGSLYPPHRLCRTSGDEVVFEGDGGVFAGSVNTGVLRRVADGTCVDVIGDTVIAESAVGTTATSLSANAQYFLGSDRANAVTRVGERWVLSSGARVWSVSADGSGGVTLGGNALKPSSSSSLVGAQTFVSIDDRVFWRSPGSTASTEVQSARTDGGGLTSVSTADVSGFQGLWRAGSHVVGHGWSGSEHIAMWNASSPRTLVQGQFRGVWGDQVLRSSSGNGNVGVLDRVDPASGSAVRIANNFDTGLSGLGSEYPKVSADGEHLLFHAFAEDGGRTCSVAHRSGGLPVQLPSVGLFAICLGFSDAGVSTTFLVDGGNVLAQYSLSGAPVVEHRLGRHTFPVAVGAPPLVGEFRPALGVIVDDVELMYSFEDDLTASPGTVWSVPRDGGVPRQVLSVPRGWPSVVLLGTD